jgi:WD40 repeat protein
MQLQVLYLKYLKYLARTSNKYNNVLAIPYNTKGAIRIELYDIGKTSIIYGHDAELVCIALNNDGTLLASASEKGTLIRLWNCNSGEIIRGFQFNNIFIFLFFIFYKLI